MQHDQFYSFFEAEKLVSDFEYVLNYHGIEICKNTELERLCLNIINILELHIKPNLRNPKADIRIPLREYAGMVELMKKIVKAKDHPQFQQIIPHLKKLNNSYPLQNTGTSVREQENDKIFELFIATLCLGMNIGKISIDDPNISKGDNPDVLAMINNKMWGFGCKSLHSSNLKTIFDNIIKAVDQIEKSPADVGIPILNIKNIIDHDKFWPVLSEREELKFVPFWDESIPVHMMHTFIDKIQEDLLDLIGEKNLIEIFRGKKSEPGCLVYCPTTTSIVINSYPTTTRLNIFNLMDFNDVSRECILICTQLNHQLQLAK